MTRTTARLARTAVAWLVLGVAAYFMLFPFTYMIASSLKTPEDTFRVPPRLLPREQIMAEVEGYDDPLPLHFVEIDGEEERMALARRSVPIGFFEPLGSAGAREQRLIDEARLLDEAESAAALAAEPAAAGGASAADAELWEIELDGRLVNARLVSRSALGLFVDPERPERQAYANARLAPRVESLSWRPENYKEVFELQGLGRSLSNTVLITVLVVVGQLVTSVMGGYAFARLRFPGRAQLFLIYLGTYMIPFVVLVIPLYQVMVALDWVNTLTALVVPWVFSVYGTFLMRQFFLAIPKELEEAAHIDGAPRGLILRKIFIPAIMPGIATLGTFAFLYAWNSFLWPLIIIKIGSDNAVLTLALSQLQGRASDKLNLILAGAAVTVLPPVMVFIAMQKYYLSSIMSSAVKG